LITRPILSSIFTRAIPKFSYKFTKLKKMMSEI